MTAEHGEPHPPPASDPLVGTVLNGKYRLEILLARGGTGAVYRAIQLPIHRPVAVKLMRADLDARSREIFEERFLREAAQVGALRHPHVVTLYDFGRTEGGVCYLVMELLEGHTLKDALSTGPSALSWGLEISLQILRGLRAAHRRGLVHRDIKAGNVMLVPDEDGNPQAKLLDFGLVKMLDEHTLSGPDVFMGTPHYVSPEQAQGREVDARSDVYSMGVLMYRIFSGRLPFSNPNAMAVAMAHVQDPYPPMAERAPQAHVPPVLEALIRRCMEKDPARRYSDAQPLYEAILEVRQELFPELVSPHTETIGERTALSPAAEGTSTLVPSPQPPARSAAALWLAIPLVTFLVIAAMGGTWLAARSPTASPPTVVMVPTPAIPPPPTAAVAAAPREVPILVSSDPAGAEVLLEDLVLGETPYAGRLTLAPGEPSLRLLTLRKTGHVPVEVAIDLSGEQAAAHASLSPRSSPRSPPTAPSTPKGSTGSVVVADEVVFTPAEAAATVAFLNTAAEEALRGAGIASKQVGIILQARPFSSIEAFAATHYIGNKTVEAARRAALSSGG